MIVDCAVYEDGARCAGDLPLAEAGEAAERDGAFVWIGVYEPSKEEFDAVRREFDLHELAVEDAIVAHQRPKVERYGDTLLVVLKTVRYTGKLRDVETGEILLFVNRDFVVSVRHGEAALHDVRLDIEKRPDLLRFGSGAVLYAIVDRIVDDYEPVVEAVESDIQEVEHEVFAPTRSNPAERIYTLEREVLDLHRAIAPLSPAIDKLARGQHEIIHPELRTYFRDVHDHLLRVSGRIDGFRDLLSSALQANLTQAAVRQNEDMRKISAWVAILAVPTGVAAIYGMNFDLHARAGVALRLPGRAGLDRAAVRAALLALPPLRLALRGSAGPLDRRLSYAARCGGGVGGGARPVRGGARGRPGSRYTCGGRGGRLGDLRRGRTLGGQHQRLQLARRRARLHRVPRRRRRRGDRAAAIARRRPRCTSAAAC